MFHVVIIQVTFSKVLSFNRRVCAPGLWTDVPDLQPGHHELEEMLTSTRSAVLFLEAEIFFYISQERRNTGYGNIL